MEYVNKIKEIADLFRDTAIVTFGNVIYIMDSTVPNIISMYIGDDLPSWLSTILNTLVKILEYIPLLGTATVFELILGVGINTIIVFCIIRFINILS